MSNIPLAKPFFDDAEIKEVTQAIKSGWVTQGPRVAQFENNFKNYVGADFACAVSNCTAALVMALKAVGVQPGDVVLTTSHTFIATANAIRFCGAEPIFIDISPQDYNMDPQKLAICLEKDFEPKENVLIYKHRDELLKNSECPLNDMNKKDAKLSALLLVHQIGLPANLNPILDLAKTHGIPVVEDAACAIGSEIKTSHNVEKIGKPHGDIACFSFHPRKIMTTGDGGMLTTNNPEYDKFFRLYRQHGMDVNDQQRHESKSILIENYVMTGFNFRLTDIQAALGIAQLEKLPQIIERRRQLASEYIRAFSTNNKVKTFSEADYSKTNWQSFPVMLDCEDSLKFLEALKERGISAKRGISCAHQERPYQESSHLFDLRESERQTKQTIFLPLFHQMTDADVEKVVQELNKLMD